MARNQRARGLSGTACRYCKRTMAPPPRPGQTGSALSATHDHVTPKCMGGRLKVPCCQRCNNLKGDLHPLDWFWFIGAHPRYFVDYRTNGEVRRTIKREQMRRAYARPTILFAGGLER